MPDTPLNPAVVWNLRALADEGTRELRHVVLEPDLLHKLLDVAEAVGQPEVNSVDELDALPEGTVLLVTDKRPGVGKSSWELFSDVLELRDSVGELEPKAWASPAYTTEYTCKSLWEIADQINVLYRPR